MNTKEQLEENLNKIDKQNSETYKPSSFKLVVCAIVSAHVAIVAAFLLFGNKTTEASPAIDEPKYVGTNSTEQRTADQQFLDQQVPMDGFATNSTKSKPEQTVQEKPVDRLPNKLLNKNQKQTPVREIPKQTLKFLETYTVKKGDTLYSIAKKYKLSYKKLLDINNIKDPNKLHVGQKIKFM